MDLNRSLPELKVDETLLDEEVDLLISCSGCEDEDSAM